MKIYNLLPCPFCGKKPLRVKNVDGFCAIYCNCDLQPTTGSLSDEHEAIQI